MHAVFLAQPVEDPGEPQDGGRPCARSENSVAIASNESFGGWARTFTDPCLCTAIADRLTFNVTIVGTGTDS